MIGQRRDLEIVTPLSFHDDWEEELRERAANSSAQGDGIEYFIYPSTIFRDVPPFAIGRVHYDNWLCYTARRYAIPVIDATAVVTAIHQVHPSNPQLMLTDEWHTNKMLMGDELKAFTPTEATHVLTQRGLLPRCRSCYPVCGCHPDA